MKKIIFRHDSVKYISLFLFFLFVKRMKIMIKDFIIVFYLSDFVIEFPLLCFYKFIECGCLWL